MEVSSQLQTRPLYVSQTAARTKLMRDCAGFTADLNALENKRISSPRQEPNHSASDVQSLASSTCGLRYRVQIIMIMMKKLLIFNFN
jgi:hypothetical protein